MKIERPNSLEITPEESQELEYLRVTIERAIKDGDHKNRIWID